MRSENGATWRLMRTKDAALRVLSALVLLCFVVLLCRDASAQMHGKRSVQQAASETQYSSQRSHVKTPASTDEENEDEDDDWDFMNDAAILSLAAQQQAASASAHADAGGCARLLQPAFLNDDYCDCEDGSDEPLTSACSHIATTHSLAFQCRSGGQMVVSAFVGDGVCDCCDGSDEVVRNCPNTCVDLHEARLENLHKRVEAVHTGLRVRDSYFAQYEPKIESLASELEETMSIASAVQRAFQYKQQQFQAAGTHPSPQEMQELESMYYQLQKWQYQAFVQHKVLDKTTFGDKEWKEPFAALVGQCFEHIVNEKDLKGGTANVVPREYVFTFCPFQNITQSEPSYPQWTIAERNEKKDRRYQTILQDQQPIPQAPHPILLGIWSQWTAPGNSKLHRAQRYDHGQKCANDQERIVNVELSCGDVNRVVSLEENEMCIYSLVFATPAACDERDEALLDHEISQVQALLLQQTADEEEKESIGTAKPTTAQHEEL